MSYLYFTDVERDSYPVCLLVPAIRKDEIRQAYLDPYGVNPADVMVMDLHYDRTKKKTSMADMKEWIISELVPSLENIGTEYIVVADAEYLKALTKAVKVDATLGYV